MCRKRKRKTARGPTFVPVERSRSQGEWELAFFAHPRLHQIGVVVESTDHAEAIGSSRFHHGNELNNLSENVERHIAGSNGKSQVWKKVLMFSVDRYHFFLYIYGKCMIVS